MSQLGSEPEGREPLKPTPVLETSRGPLNARRGRGGQSGNWHLQRVPVLHTVKQHPHYNFLTNFIKRILLVLLWF